MTKQYRSQRAIPRECDCCQLPCRACFSPAYEKEHMSKPNPLSHRPKEVRRHQVHLGGCAPLEQLHLFQGDPDFTPGVLRGGAIKIATVTTRQPNDVGQRRSAATEVTSSHRHEKKQPGGNLDTYMHIHIQKSNVTLVCCRHFRPKACQRWLASECVLIHNVPHTMGSARRSTGKTHRHTDTQTTRHTDTRTHTECSKPVKHERQKGTVLE